ncbi:unnamed protein product [Amoebophrya sp. A120]|nr:unnamed protein product [Amoebophrya sp. A120]|eukprot:GSA120T00011698001.1
MTTRLTFNRFPSPLRKVLMVGAGLRLILGVSLRVHNADAYSTSHYHSDRPGIREDEQEDVEMTGLPSLLDGTANNRTSSRSSGGAFLEEENDKPFSPTSASSAAFARYKARVFAMRPPHTEDPPESWVQKRCVGCVEDSITTGTGSGRAVAGAAAGTSASGLMAFDANQQTAAQGYLMVPPGSYLHVGSSFTSQQTTDPAPFLNDYYTHEPWESYKEYANLVQTWQWQDGWAAFSGPAFQAEMQPWDLDRILREKNEYSKGYSMPSLVRVHVSAPLNLYRKMDASGNPVSQNTDGLDEPLAPAECSLRLRGWYVNDYSQGEACRPIGTLWLRPAAAYQLRTQTLNGYKNDRYFADYPATLFAKVYDETMTMYTKALQPLTLRLTQHGNKVLTTMFCVPNGLSGDGSCYFLEWPCEDQQVQVQVPGSNQMTMNSVCRATADSTISVNQVAHLEDGRWEPQQPRVRGSSEPAYSYLLGSRDLTSPTLLPFLRPEDEEMRHGVTLEVLYLRKDPQWAQPHFPDQVPRLERFEWLDMFPKTTGMTNQDALEEYGQAVFHQVARLGLLSNFENLLQTLRDMIHYHLPLPEAEDKPRTPQFPELLLKEFGCEPEAARRMGEQAYAARQPKNSLQGFAFADADKQKCTLKDPWGLAVQVDKNGNRYVGGGNPPKPITFETAVDEMYTRASWVAFFEYVCLQLGRLRFDFITDSSAAIMEEEGMEALLGLQPMSLDFQLKWFQLNSLTELLQNNVYSAIIRGGFMARYMSKHVYGIYLNLNELMEETSSIMSGAGMPAQVKTYMSYTYRHLKLALYKSRTPNPDKQKQDILLEQLVQEGGKWESLRTRYTLPVQDEPSGGLNLRFLFSDNLPEPQIYDGSAMQLLQSEQGMQLPARPSSDTTLRMMASAEFRGQGDHILHHVMPHLINQDWDQMPDVTVHVGSLLLLDSLTQSTPPRTEDMYSKSRQAQRQLESLLQFPEDVKAAAEYDSGHGDVQARNFQGAGAAPGPTEQSSSFTEVPSKRKRPTLSVRDDGDDTDSQQRAATDTEHSVASSKKFMQPKERAAVLKERSTTTAGRKPMASRPEKKEAFTQRTRTKKLQMKTGTATQSVQHTDVEHTTIVGMGPHDRTLAGAHRPLNNGGHHGEYNKLYVLQSCSVPDVFVEKMDTNARRSGVSAWVQCALGHAEGHEFKTWLQNWAAGTPNIDEQAQKYGRELYDLENTCRDKLSGYSGYGGLYENCNENNPDKEGTIEVYRVTFAVSSVTKSGNESPGTEKLANHLQLNPLQVPQETSGTVLEKDLFPLYWAMCKHELETGGNGHAHQWDRGDAPAKQGPNVLGSSQNLLAESLETKMKIDHMIPAGTDVVLQAAHHSFGSFNGRQKIGPGVRFMPSYHSDGRWMPKALVTMAATRELLQPVMPLMFLDYDPSTWPPHTSGSQTIHPHVIIDVWAIHHKYPSIMMDNGIFADYVERAFQTLWASEAGGGPVEQHHHHHHHHHHRAQCEFDLGIAVCSILAPTGTDHNWCKHWKGAEKLTFHPGGGPTDGSYTVKNTLGREVNDQSGEKGIADVDETTALITCMEDLHF